MKKISILITAMILLVFILPAFSEKSIPTSSHVEIINSPENPVPVMTTGECKKTVISKFFEFRIYGPAPAERDFVVLATVPEGQVFVLTDIYATRITGNHDEFHFELLENDDLKYIPGEIRLNLISGISFAAGSTVHINYVLTAGDWSDGKIFVSGYLIDY